MSKPPPARGVRAGVRQDAKGEEKGVYDPRGAGAAWSHGFLNQKPWHPLSFRNQQKKWETEQKHLEREKKIAEGKAEFEREQEQFRSLSYLTPEEQKKYKDKQQIAFMYMKPPGLDAALKKEKAKDQESDQAGPSHMVKVESTNQKKAKVDAVRGGFDEKGPMASMLRARANYESSHGLEFRQMSPARGGFSRDADNQQFLVPDLNELGTGGLSSEGAKRSMKRKSEQKRRVQEAEAVLRAAGYDVDQISKHFKKSKKHKHSSKSNKKKRARRKSRTPDSPGG